MRYYAVVEESREAEFTFTDEEMKAVGCEDEYEFAYRCANHELSMVDKPMRYINVYTLDEGVE
jgi:hypothetical protein